MAAMKTLVVSVLAALALAACAPAGNGAIEVTEGRINPPLGVHGVSAGYFTLQNNGPADVLISAATPVAEATELHESTMENGMMAMRRLDKVDVPAGGIVSFAPGGKHLMLMGANAEAIVPGRSVTVTLTFEKAGAKEFAFVVGEPSSAAH